MRLHRVALPLFVSVLAFGQDKVQPRLVRVSGVAEVNVTPDRAVLEIGVEKQNAVPRLAKQAADDVARRIFAGLKQNGVEEKDIQTTYLSLQPRYDYRKGMRVSYFAASQTISITVRELTKLDSVMDALIKVGGNEIDSIRYETSDLRKYRDQARELAITAAKEKAQALAHSLGQEIGKAYSIDEEPETGWNGLLANETVSAGILGKAKSAGPSTSTGERKVSATVTVAFDLM